LARASGSATSLETCWAAGHSSTASMSYRWPIQQQPFESRN